MITEGIDPIMQREKRRDREREALDKRDPTFKNIAEQVFEVKKARFGRSADHLRRSVEGKGSWRAARMSARAVS